ncbi:hypothetical protein [Helicobacter sp. T3_23-1059]
MIKAFFFDKNEVFSFFVKKLSVFWFFAKTLSVLTQNLATHLGIYPPAKI